MSDARLNCFRTYGWHMLHRQQKLCIRWYTARRKFVPLHAMKAYWEMEIPLRSFLTSELEVGQWSASSPGRFIPGKWHPGAVRNGLDWKK